MYKIGLYGGTFSPLHIGHVKCIIQASCLCEKLYIVINSSQNPNEIDIKIRYRWLYQITKDMPNVNLIILEDKNTSKSSYTTEQAINDTNKILSIIKSPIDIVFCGSDYDKNSFWNKNYPDSKLYIFKRDEISSTKIRSNPYLYWDWLPNIVKPYYVKKIMICGIESSGKTVLTTNLSKYYNTNYVEESGKLLSEKSGSDELMISDDFTEILLTQKLNELNAINNSNKILFCDTDALYTLFYLEYFYNDSLKKNIDLAYAIDQLNTYDLILLLEPTNNWNQDGDRKEDIRDNHTKYFNRIIEGLDKSGKKYVRINGEYLERFNKCIEYINELFK